MEYSLGIDLGGSHIAAAVVDGEGHLLYKRSRNTDTSGGVKGVAADIGQLGQSILTKLDSKKRDSLLHLGVGVPGPIHPRTQNVIYAGNLGWENAENISELDTYKTHLEVQNIKDADCAERA